MEHLFSVDCSLVIVACNTASAETLRRLQDEYLVQNHPEKRILGVIVPTIEALNEQVHGNALLLATKRTVDSKKYERELARKGRKEIELHAIALTELVPLIEKGDMERATQIASRVIVEFYGGAPGTVVLGCTHYSLMKDVLRAKFPALTFLSQDEIIPDKLHQYLLRHPERDKRLRRKGERHIHLTEERPDYDLLTAQLLSTPENPAI